MNFIDVYSLSSVYLDKSIYATVAFEVGKLSVSEIIFQTTIPLMNQPLLVLSCYFQYNSDGTYWNRNRLSLVLDKSDVGNRHPKRIKLLVFFQN